MPVQWSVAHAHKENKSCKETSIHSLWTVVPGPSLQQGPDSLKPWAAIAPEGLQFLLIHANINQSSHYWSQVSYAGVTSMWQTELMDVNRAWNRCPFVFHTIFHSQPLVLPSYTSTCGAGAIGWLMFRRNHTLRSMHTAGIQLEPNMLEAV